MIKKPTAMLKELCKKIETESIGAKFDSEEKIKECQ